MSQSIVAAKGNKSNSDCGFGREAPADVDGSGPVCETIRMPNPSKADLEQRLTALLGELGADADAVADSLRGRGVRGLRNAVSILNPVIRYALTRVPVDAWRFDVRQRDTVRLTMPGGVVVNVPLPRPVAQFLDGFDAGRYKDLELPPG